MPEYPGWNMDLRWTDQEWRQGLGRAVTYPIGIHYNCFGASSAMLLVREVALMLVMERLTDKPDWHVKVFDDEIAEKWKTEALAWPNTDLWDRIAQLDPSNGRWNPKMPENILDKECLDHCILELRAKAEHFKRTGITPTLDATFSIAKSDGLVPTELQSALREAFARLKADQVSRPDWHPNSDEKVQDLVHPSMYPLVYGRSRFLPEEVVGVEDAVDKWAGKGEVIPRRAEWGEEPTQRATRSRWHQEPDTGPGGSGIHKSYWSTIYQWLPANVRFTADGGVQFSSYINNLHPTKHRDIYGTIEKLIETALPMWDQCLAQYKSGTRIGAGRHKPRLEPEHPDDGHEDNWNPKSVEDMLAQEAAAKGTSTSEEQAKASDSESDDEDEQWDRWRETRQPIHTDLSSYSSSDVSYNVDPSKTLREQFKNTGLQIIVKMASIELTPEKPEFSPGGWHVEGMMNEHIVGTVLYYLDSENITDSHLDFRTLTSYDQDQYWQVGQDNFHWMESMYGVKLGSGSGGACLQNYGSVKTPQGRLLAFPNVFQHRVSGFKLVDPTKPGHRRFIALWLVDPFTRIISTANVPPQQADWWSDRAFGALKANDGTLPAEITQLLLERGLGGSQLAEAMSAKEAKGAKLPVELMEMVRKELGDALPMTREEAEEHRLKLMQARSSFQEEARGNWESVEYSFCEH